MPDQSQLPEDGFVHVPVLAAPLLQALAASADAPWQNGLLIDATLGVLATALCCWIVTRGCN